MSSTSDDPRHVAIGRALGRIPSGVFILVAGQPQQASVMMASWVQQVAFEPPAISVAIARGRPIADVVRATRRFTLSVVPNEDKSLMRRYARGVKEGEDPFADVRTQPAPSGVPVLSDALAWLDCSVISTHEFGGDHELFIARVDAGEMLRDGTAFKHERGNGFHY